MRRKQIALERAFHKANRMNAENIYEVIGDFKTLDDATDEEKDAMADYIAERMGYGQNIVTNEQMRLLTEGGYIEGASS